MDQADLSRFQSHEAGFGRQMVIGHLPEDVGVDDADVQQPPEDVLPPPDAGTTNTVVGPQLVEPVHSSHPPVVALDTGGCQQLDFRVIPPHRLHHVQPLVIGCHHEDITTVPPLHQHDTGAALSFPVYTSKSRQ